MSPNQQTQTNQPTPNQPTAPPSNQGGAQPAPPQQPAQPNPQRMQTPNRQDVTQVASNNTVKPPEDKKKQASTQDSLQIAEVRDGIVIMRDGSLRSVVMCQSINFDLMSTQEREAIELSYQSFLNSLYFPVQILVRSQRVDLNAYMERLEQVRNDQENILLGLLTEDYIAYVRYLIEASNIMDKQFYIVVPYYPPIMSQEGIATSIRRMLTFFKPPETVVLNETDFTKHKSELAQRVQVVLNGMFQIGVQAIPLNTQELIELYYGFYNPDTSLQQDLTDINQLESPMVEKGQPQQAANPQATGGNQQGAAQ